MRLQKLARALTMVTLQITDNVFKSMQNTNSAQGDIGFIKLLNLIGTSIAVV